MIKYLSANILSDTKPIVMCIGAIVSTPTTPSCPRDYILRPHAGIHCIDIMFCRVGLTSIPIGGWADQVGMDMLLWVVGS